HRARSGIKPTSVANRSNARRSGGDHRRHSVAPSVRETRATASAVALPRSPPNARAVCAVTSVASRLPFTAGAGAPVSSVNARLERDERLGVAIADATRAHTPAIAAPVLGHPPTGRSEEHT